MSANLEPFQSAREYYRGDRPDRGDGPPLAKAIIWYDQRTPLFVCGGCEPDVRTLRHAGDGRAADYEQRRTSAYTRLFSRSTTASLNSGSDTLAIKGTAQKRPAASRALPARSPKLLHKRERRHGLRCACKHTMTRYPRNPRERTATPQIPNTCCPTAAVLHATGRDTYRCGCCFDTVEIEDGGER